MGGQMRQDADLPFWRHCKRYFHFQTELAHADAPRTRVYVISAWNARRTGETERKVFFLLMQGEDHQEDVAESKPKSLMPQEWQTIVINVGLLCFSYLVEYKTP